MDFFKKNFLLTIPLFFVLQHASSQIQVLEKPEFPAPAKEMLYFLSEERIWNSNNYNGNVDLLEKIYTETDKTGNIITRDTIISEPTNMLKHFKVLGQEPILDRIGIDKITKVGRETYFLYSADSLDYSSVVYTMLKTKIVALTEDTSVYVNDVMYFYNEQGLLVKKTYFNEYGNGVINKAVYNNKGQIIKHSRFDNSDGLSVTIKKYTYNSEDLLTKYEESDALYFVDFTNEAEGISIDEVDYLKYKKPDTYMNVHRIDFEYNDEAQLKKVNETKNAYTEEDGIQEQSSRQYLLSYAPNQLIVKASLPEKRKYIYTFDNQNNPKEISSFVVEEEDTWLHKNTVFNVTYKN